MANIVVTSTTNSIKVVFNDYSTTFNMSKAVWQKKDVRFELRPSDAFVAGLVKNEAKFALAYTSTTNCFIIDSIDGVSPSSNSDLYDKLIALIA